MGKIIDGLNRFRACEKAWIEPRFREYQGKGEPDDLVKFVRSLNQHRRHLTKTQLGMVGARIRHFFEEEAKKRQIASLKQGGDSVTQERDSAP